jgi:hypothetical protein
MASDALTHDVAMATATHIVELFAARLGEEGQREAFAEVYVAVKAGLECFQIQDNQMQRRMGPGVN